METVSFEMPRVIHDMMLHELPFEANLRSGEMSYRVGPFHMDDHNPDRFRRGCGPHLFMITTGITIRSQYNRHEKLELFALQDGGKQDITCLADVVRLNRLKTLDTGNRQCVHSHWYRIANQLGLECT